MKLNSLGDWRRTHYSCDVTPKLDGKEITLFGWIQEIRDLGGIRFLILKDREGTIQIIIPKDTPNSLLKKSEILQKKYAIGVKGIVKKTDMTFRGVEVIPKDIKVLSKAKARLPIDITGKTPASIDVRLNARALDLCLAENTAIFKVQHTAVEAIRNFVFEQGFIEVHTPRIIISATEGGAALFPVEYFDKTAFLAQSPQLYKEELSMSLEKVFEIGPFFRAEDSHTRRHLSEFVSIDIEQAFASAKDVMKLIEQVMQHTCKIVNEMCKKELDLLKNKIDVPEVPFIRLKYDEVLQDLKDFDISWGEDIPTQAFRSLGKIHPYFYFITDWPTQSKAFYIKPKDDKPEFCEGFDLMWSWIELASGGSRIASKELLMKRLEEKGLKKESFKHHLRVFDYGMPPHAGWAIGLERLTMMLTGRKNIREVTLFPRDKFRLTP